ncbi:unnamed protein product [Leptosia nina]|uniref:pyruvate kinase n=1 Tax=Leptosia nina TaxID=320188 RepID=A0AAV1JCR7_9NEOP
MVEKIPETIKFNDVDISDPNILERPCNRFRRCPVIVTLSDNQIATVEIQKLLEAGMNIVKFKMSFTTKGDKIRMLGRVDKAALACCRKNGVLDWPVATCVELKTCIVKTGLLESNADYISIKEGARLILTCRFSEFNKCNERKIFVDNPTLSKDITPGTEISIGSDEIILKCEAVLDQERIKCVVVKGGSLRNVCNVCARGVEHKQSHITKKDLDIVKFALRYQESDGIILSREFLPFEIEASEKFRLPHIQKWLSGKCLEAGKPFYLSGGVFKDALYSGLFHDNEIADVVNALMDGVSGFILRDCFNVANTLEVLYAINETCYFVEPIITSRSGFWRLLDEVKIPCNAAEAAMLSCSLVANQTNARIIIMPTVSGKTIKALHLMRPSCIVIAVSTRIHVFRLLHTYRSVMPLMYKESRASAAKSWHDAVEDKIHFAIEYVVQRGYVVYGDTYVTLQRGAEDSSFCDMVRVWKVSITKKLLVE